MPVGGGVDRSSQGGCQGDTVGLGRNGFEVIGTEGTWLEVGKNHGKDGMSMDFSWPLQL